MSKWYEYYKDRVNDRYDRHINERYAPFIDKLVSTAVSLEVLGFHPIFIELGCGIGSITKAVQAQLPKNLHLLFDNDEAMLSLAKKNTCPHRSFMFLGDMHHGHTYHKLGILIKNYRIQLQNKKIAVIIHSHGVLEHFEDALIYKYFKRFPLKRDKTNTNFKFLQFHYVPTHKYKTKSFGDERLLSPAYWENMFCKNIIEFNDGYDIIITDKD